MTLASQQTTMSFHMSTQSSQFSHKTLVYTLYKLRIYGNPWSQPLFNSWFIALQRAFSVGWHSQRVPRSDCGQGANQGWPSQRVPRSDCGQGANQGWPSQRVPRSDCGQGANQGWPSQRVPWSDCGQGANQGWPSQRVPWGGVQWEAALAASAASSRR